MPPTHTHDLLIAGAGPAGLAAALHLVRSDRRWAERMVVVERATHPRDKLCGGGVTRTGEEELAELGLGWNGGGAAGSQAPPNVPITELRLAFGERAWAARGETIFRVTRRRELDSWLLRAAEREGVEVRQGEAVMRLETGSDGVRVETDRAIYRVAALLGADGSTGTVRRRLGWEAGERQARLLEVLTPESPEGGAGPAGWRGVAVFDFTPMTAGVRGYYWDFPSLVDGRPVMNRGIFDSRAGRGTLAPGTSLKQLLAEALERRGRRLDDHTLDGHPIRWFDRRARVAAPRVLLAGDAAGVDPLLGEGISFAFAHGRVAAAAVADAFARRDLAFGSYPARLLADPVLAQLARRRRLAEWVYRLRGRRSITAVWAVLPWLFGALMRFRPGILPIDPVRLERVLGPEPVFQGG